MRETSPTPFFRTSLVGAALSCALLWAPGCGPSDRPVIEESAGGEVELSLVQSLNAQARRGAVTETLFGAEIEDPYRSLEEDSEATRDWIDRQTERTDAALAGWTDPEAARRLGELLAIDAIGGAEVAGRFFFFELRRGQSEQPALYRVPAGTAAAVLPEAPLLDPTRFGEHASLDFWVPSPSGRYLAFGVSSNGDERSVIHVLDAESGEILPDRIPNAKWSQISWLHSEEGFYYRRYGYAGEPHFDPEAPDSYFPRLAYHRLGADPAGEPLVYVPAEGTLFPSVEVSEDDRWLTLAVYNGWSRSDLYVFDRGAQARTRRIAPDEAHPWVTVFEGRDALFSGSIRRGRLFVHTNLDHPRYRILSVDAAQAGQAASGELFREVVPEGSGPIEGWAFTGDKIAVHAIEGYRSRLRLYPLGGGAPTEVALPGSGALGTLSGHLGQAHLLVEFSSIVHAPGLYALAVGEQGAALRPLVRVDAGIDLSAFTVSQGEARSADGTMINVTYAHRSDLARDGQSRVLLRAYGGFNVSLLPGFERNALYWLERGGVYAVANLRGGGENGESWHRAGMLENKQRVFEDMAAATRWLSESGLSSPDRIALYGASNGGLLMGAMINQAPEAFRVAIASVGLYDMLRFTRFPPAELWVSEYGNPENEEHFQMLRGYSPYHNIRAGGPWPAVLVSTADHDNRVHWAHSTKMAARLQEASGAAEPEIYFHMARQVGHGAGTRLTDLVARYVRMYAFIEHFLGAPRPASPEAGAGEPEARTR